MKRLICFCLLLVVNFGVKAQNLGINTGGTAPNASAGLDIDFTNKGLLIPRMTTAQRDAIVNPAQSLMIYNTTSNCFEVYNFFWQSLVCSLPPASVSTLNCAGALVTGCIIKNIAASGVSVSVPYSGSNGGVYASQTISSTGVVGLTATLAAGTLASGTGNLSLTITGTATVSGTASFSFTFGGQSCSFSVTVFAAVGAFSANAATNVCGNNFSANWTASSNATGYYLDVATDAGFANMVSGYNNLSVGNVLTYSVVGLASNTPYYYRVRSTNGCSVSASTNTVSVSTVSSCIIAQAATAYGTVTNVPGATSLTWITRNLGASVQATSATDASDAAAGCYFQFNRAQAYTNNLCDGTATVSPAWTITSINENSNWLIANDPCRINLGGTWRIPTSTEWTNVDASGAWTTSAMTYASVLKLHQAGFLAGGGSLSNRGVIGYYWASTQITNTTAYNLSIASSSSVIASTIFKTTGLSLRCVY